MENIKYILKVTSLGFLGICLATWIPRPKLNLTLIPAKCKFSNAVRISSIYWIAILGLFYYVVWDIDVVYHN